VAKLARQVDWPEKHLPEAQDAIARFEAQYEGGRESLDSPLQVTPVLSGCLDTGTHRASRSDRYPGRAGVLHGLTARAFELAVGDDRLTTGEWRDFDERQSKVVYGVFWAAIVSGEADAIPKEEAELYLTKALGCSPDTVSRADWRKGMAILERVGLVVDLSGGETWCSIHPLLAEHWAACHLAGRLVEAMEANVLKAELNDYASEPRFDGMLSQALAMGSSDHAGMDLLGFAFRALEERSVGDAAYLLARTESPRAPGIILDVATEANSDVVNRIACGLIEARTSQAVEILTRIIRVVECPPGRWGAVAALGELRAEGLPGCAEPLLASLGDSDSQVRGFAVMALGHGPLDDELVGAILDRLENDPVESVCLAALDVLERHAPDGVMARLAGLHEHGSLTPRVSEAVHAALSPPRWR
jgi:hypothetical protein